MTMLTLLAIVWKSVTDNRALFDIVHSDLMEANSRNDAKDNILHPKVCVYVLRKQTDLIMSHSYEVHLRHDAALSGASKYPQAKTLNSSPVLWHLPKLSRSACQWANADNIDVRLVAGAT